MVRPKAGLNKKPKRGGVDFKKVRRKIGRKLPPPKNATNTQIKSKAIILPEQSLASNKEGLLLNRKGKSLSELLVQTKHFNRKNRADALIGLRDLTLHHSEELKLHIAVITETLSLLISDPDKGVRENLHSLLVTIFRGLEEDVKAPLISRMLLHIFNAMTHLHSDVRLMALKFLDLIFQHYPSSIRLHIDKMLDNYMTILSNQYIFLDDTRKLTDALSVLVCCLSSLTMEQQIYQRSYEQKASEKGVLHAYLEALPTGNADNGFSTISRKLQKLVPVLVIYWKECFRLLSSDLNDGKTVDCLVSILRSINLLVKLVVVDETCIGDPVASLDKGAARKGCTLPQLLEDVLGPCFSTMKDNEQGFMLKAGITEIFLRLNKWMDFHSDFSVASLSFLEDVLHGKIDGSKKSFKLVEKHLMPCIPLIPELITKVTHERACSLLEKGRLFERGTSLLLEMMPIKGDFSFLVKFVDLYYVAEVPQAFTNAFEGCKANSELKLSCLSSMERILSTYWDETVFAIATTKGKEGSQDIAFSDSMRKVLKVWICALPKLLVELGHGHPSSVEALLRFYLHILQCEHVNAVDYLASFSSGDLVAFYSYGQTGNGNLGGPFMKLPRVCQEIAICCLYYMPRLPRPLLESLASCCLCHNLESVIITRIIDAVHSSYKAGCVGIEDHISFLISLIVRFRVESASNNSSIGICKEKASGFREYRVMVRAVCSCLSEMGDGDLIFRILQPVIVHELTCNLPIDNRCAVIRMILVLDSGLMELSDEIMNNLGHWLSEYLIHAASVALENELGVAESHERTNDTFYIIPCIYLLQQNQKLLSAVLELLLGPYAKPCVDQPSFLSQHSQCVDYIFMYMSRFKKLRMHLLSCEAHITSMIEKFRRRREETLRESKNII